MDVPIKNGGSFRSYLSLPEGNQMVSIAITMAVAGLQQGPGWPGWPGWSLAEGHAPVKIDL